MTARRTVIEHLNDLISIELMAVNQYFVHAKICEHRGYDGLAKRLRDASMEEMRDIEALMDRVLMLDGLPNLQRLDAFQVGETVTEQLTLAADLERIAVARLKVAVAACDGAGDVGTAELLRPMVASEEGQLDWIETQMQLLGTLGEPLYLAQHLQAE
jgi:bacterioferritin